VVVSTIADGRRGPSRPRVNARTCRVCGWTASVGVRAAAGRSLGAAVVGCRLGL